MEGWRTKVYPFSSNQLLSSLLDSFLFFFESWTTDIANIDDDAGMYLQPTNLLPLCTMWIRWIFESERALFESSQSHDRGRYYHVGRALLLAHGYAVRLCGSSLVRSVCMPSLGWGCVSNSGFSATRTHCGQKIHATFEVLRWATDCWVFVHYIFRGFHHISIMVAARCTLRHQWIARQ